MKFQTRFTTRSGSTYVWSPMGCTLYKIERDGSRTIELRDVDPSKVHVRHGERAVFEGVRWRHDWWQPGNISTTPVVTVDAEPDWMCELLPGANF